MPDLRLAGAESLKLRRRHGMLAIAILLTLGIVVLFLTVTGIQHAGDSAHHRPPGGAYVFRDLVGLIGSMAMVVGAIVGATAGTQDMESGMFRDLAATGRSRLALFAARVLGAWAVLLPILAVSTAVMGTVSVVLAGSAPAPTAGALVWGSLGILMAGALGSATAVGVSTLVGSRGVVIGVMLAFYLAIEPLLAAIGFLGAARQALPSVALATVGHVEPPGDVHAALGLALVVAIAWMAVALGLGAWKTTTREI